MQSSARVTLCAVALLAGGVAIQAQSPTPSPAGSATPAPTPVVFSAQAHVNVTATAQTTYDATAQLAVAQRGPLIRVQLISVRSDSFPLPPLSATAVIDRRANTATVWSEATKSYFVQPIVPRLGSSSPRPSASPAPRRSPSPRPLAGARSPFSKLEVLDVTLHLTGHTTTAGLPTTGLAFDLRVKKQGDSQTSHVSAATQLADDYAAFPVTADVSLEPGMVPFSAKLSYAVDQFARTAPPAAEFEVPAGYTKASSLFAVIFPQRMRAVRPGSPAPSPSP